MITREVQVNIVINIKHDSIEVFRPLTKEFYIRDLDDMSTKIYRMGKMEI